MPKPNHSINRLAAEVKALKIAGKAIKVVRKARRASKAGKSGGFFGSVGKSLGSAAGGFLGAAATKALMSVTGMGDYKVHRNSLYIHSLSASPPPAFRSDSHSTRVVHREFLRDVRGAVNFTQVLKLPINPSAAQTFPWLSTMAVLFEEYKFHGLIFEFKSTSGSAISSTNAALGTVMMATQYNVYAPDFQNKVQLDAYEYSVNTKPDCSALHPIECDPKLNDREIYYVDTSLFSAGGDLRLTNMGNFYLDVAGQQADNTVLGELWVTYDVELLKPRMQANAPGASEANSAVYFNNDRTASSSGPFNSDLFRGMSLLPDANFALTGIKPSQSNFPLGFGTAAGGDANVIYFPPGFVGKLLLLFTMRIGAGSSGTGICAVSDFTTAPTLSFGTGVSMCTMMTTNADRTNLTFSNLPAADSSYGLTGGFQGGAIFFARWILAFDGSARIDPVTGKSTASVKVSTSFFTSNGNLTNTWLNTLEFYPVFL